MRSKHSNNADVRSENLSLGGIDINQNLPTLTNIYRHKPTFRNINQHLPTVTTIYRHEPTFTDINHYLPTLTNIYRH